jgi:hypothetical protein
MFGAYEVSSTCARTLLRFCLKKAPKTDSLSPLLDPPMLTLEEAEKQQKTVLFDTFSILVVSKRSSIYKSSYAFLNDLLRVCFMKS